eukprot:278975_1
MLLNTGESTDNKMEIKRSQKQKAKGVDRQAKKAMKRTFIASTEEIDHPTSGNIVDTFDGINQYHSFLFKSNDQYGCFYRPLSCNNCEYCAKGKFDQCSNA